MQPLFISASLKARSRIKPEVKWKSLETSAKHARKLKVKWRSRNCTSPRDCAHCALWLCTLHLSTLSLCTLPEWWSWWCGGKNQRLAFSRMHRSPNISTFHNHRKKRRHFQVDKHTCYFLPISKWVLMLKKRDTGEDPGLLATQCSLLKQNKFSANNVWYNAFCQRQPVWELDRCEVLKVLSVSFSKISPGPLLWRIS